MITILLADDDPLVRVGLRAVLDGEPDMTVVGEAADGNEALAMATELEPSLVIMEIRMPNRDGLEATHQIMTMPAPPKVLVLTTFELDEYVYEALQAGATGFVLKRVPPNDLIEAVRVVDSGESLVFPASTGDLIRHYVPPVPSARYSRALEALTDREREVFELLAKGLSNQEIADELYVGSETVKSHVGSLLLKLEVRDRTQAVIAAYESGFVKPGN